MNIHHLRNATFVIESKKHVILIDPMLGDQGVLPSFSNFRHKPERNPTVPLPGNAPQILETVTHCLVTHSQKWGIELLTHTDHLDPTGKSFLREKGIPVTCRKEDAAYMIKQGLTVGTELVNWQAMDFLGGKITAVPSRHGHGFLHRLMANGCGFYLELPGEPSVYISGDTVYTDDVRRALTKLKPDISVVAAGGASMDVGAPILMSLGEIVSFIRDAPGKVIANHMEALNHCPTNRTMLRQELGKRDLLSKTFIPEDGEAFSMDL